MLFAFFDNKICLRRQLACRLRSVHRRHANFMRLRQRLENIFMSCIETLKLNKEFKRLYYQGKCFAAHTVVIYIRQNRLRRNRLGLTCGKSIGNAVARNRAKRLMRESYRALAGSMRQGYDIVIIAKSRINGKKCAEVSRDVRYALFKLDMII